MAALGGHRVKKTITNKQNKTKTRKVKVCDLIDSISESLSISWESLSQ